MKKDVLNFGVALLFEIVTEQNKMRTDERMVLKALKKKSNIIYLLFNIIKLKLI